MTERISRPMYEALKAEYGKLLLEKTLWETKAGLLDAQVARLWHQTEQTMHQANNLLEFIRSVDVHTPDRTIIRFDPSPYKEEPGIGTRDTGSPDMEINTGQGQLRKE